VECKKVAPLLPSTTWETTPVGRSILSPASFMSFQKCLKVRDVSRTYVTAVVRKRDSPMSLA